MSWFTIPKTALVLGGGGITGIAWETGLLAGLAEAGIDLTQAETVVGTSAGSVVGTLVACGDDLEDLYADQLSDATGEVAESLGKAALLRYLCYLVLPGGSRTKRARLGRAAMRAETVDEAVRVDIIRGLLGEREWPERHLLITAVNAETGDFKVFDRDSGVDLVRAVASSCAVPLVWPPVSVNGHKYVDGGIRSPANADLATDARHVVVLAPIAKALSRASGVRAQLERLGPDVESIMVSPDDDALRAIGKNVLDPARRSASARAGRGQARSVLEQVKAVWPAVP